MLRMTQEWIVVESAEFEIISLALIRLPETEPSSHVRNLTRTGSEAKLVSSVPAARSFCHHSVAAVSCNSVTDSSDPAMASCITDIRDHDYGELTKMQQVTKSITYVGHQTKKAFKA